MKYCPNPQCPFLAKTGKVSEFQNQITHCSDCGTSLKKGHAPDVSSISGQEPEQPTTEASEYYCDTCKAVVGPYDKFCPMCGTELEMPIEENEQTPTDGEGLFVQLLPEEEILHVSQFFTLTTHRIRFAAETLGNSQITSIMLDELSSCSVTHTSNPFLLAIAGIIGLAVTISLLSDFEGNIIAIIAGLVIAIVLAVIYFATRKQVLELASSGAAIRVDTLGMSASKIKSLFDMIEAAKHERYLLGRSHE